MATRVRRRFPLGRKDSRSSDSGRAKEKRGGRPQRKKVCHFCKEKIEYIDFKDLSLMRKFVSDRGKIRARRTTGTCVRHQHEMASAVKNAREMALLPYVMR